jgi:hypothetical protein
MNELAFWYYIRSDLPAGLESPASLGAKFVDTLDALSRIDPTIFANWGDHGLSGASLAAARGRTAPHRCDDRKERLSQ